MVIFNFNPKSIFNNAWVRVINIIILSINVFLWSWMAFGVYEGIYAETSLIVLLYASFSTCWGIDEILHKNKWFEFDKKEAKRKEWFIVFYCCVSFLLALMIGTLVVCAFESYKNEGEYYWFALMALYFGFNKINICSLYNFNNFIENQLPWYSCNIKDAKDVRDAELEVIKYLLQRDYDIDLDELYEELRIWRRR